MEGSGPPIPMVWFGTSRTVNGASGQYVLEVLQVRSENPTEGVFRVPEEPLNYQHPPTGASW